MQYPEAQKAHFLPATLMIAVRAWRPPRTFPMPNVPTKVWLYGIHPPVSASTEHIGHPLAWNVQRKAVNRIALRDAKTTDRSASYFITGHSTRKSRNAASYCRKSRYLSVNTTRPLGVFRCFPSVILVHEYVIWPLKALKERLNTIASCRQS
jgi:hypothetical protein